MAHANNQAHLYIQNNHEPKEKTSLIRESNLDQIFNFLILSGVMTRRILTKGAVN